MESSKVIMVTSCKGGVGKSTISANLAYVLAMRGRRVLLIDLDLGMRCLDLILGLENRALYDISDVVDGGIPLESAAVCREDCGNLRFCAAPYADDTAVNAQRFRMVIEEQREQGKYDYIIIDTPGDIGRPFSLACSVADAALIVASHGPSTIRAAEHTGRMLAEQGIENARLIINNFDTDDRRAISSGARAGVTDIIDRTYLRLIGVIPYDAKFARAQEQAQFADQRTCRNVCAAFHNIARRIEGEQIRLFDGFKKISRKKLM